MNTNLLTDLRATCAMRSEDARIARKHMLEAAARIGNEKNDRAYRKAESWFFTCTERELQARSSLARACTGS